MDTPKFKNQQIEFIKSADNVTYLGNLCDVKSDGSGHDVMGSIKVECSRSDFRKFAVNDLIKFFLNVGFEYDSISVDSLVEDIDNKDNVIKIKLKIKEKNQRERLNEFLKETKTTSWFQKLSSRVLNFYWKITTYKKSRRIVSLILLIYLFYLLAQKSIYLYSENSPSLVYIVFWGFLIGKLFGWSRGNICHYIYDIPKSFLRQQGVIFRTAEKEILIMSQFINHLCYEDPIYIKYLWEAMEKRNVKVKIIFSKNHGIDPGSKFFLKWYFNKKISLINLSLFVVDEVPPNHFIVIDDHHLLIESTHDFTKVPKFKFVKFYSKNITAFRDLFKKKLQQSEQVGGLEEVFTYSIKALIVMLESEKVNDIGIKYIYLIKDQISFLLCIDIISKYSKGSVNKRLYNASHWKKQWVKDFNTLWGQKKYKFYIDELKKVIDDKPGSLNDTPFIVKDKFYEKHFKEEVKTILLSTINDY